MFEFTRENLRKAQALLAAAALLITATSASAQEVHMIEGATPSAEELADRLFPEEAATYKTRSIVMKDAPPPKPPQTIGFQVRFGFDSAEILADSRPFLDQLGQALKTDQAKEEKLVIEGHTDAIGAEEYNQLLSERRAASVRNYLVQTHKIDPARLVTKGLGEAAPLPQTKPTAPKNRRVQFRKAN